MRIRRIAGLLEQAFKAVERYEHSGGRYNYYSTNACLAGCLRREETQTLMQAVSWNEFWLLSAIACPRYGNALPDENCKRIILRADDFYKTRLSFEMLDRFERRLCDDYCRFFSRLSFDGGKYGGIFATSSDVFEAMRWVARWLDKNVGSFPDQKDMFVSDKDDAVHANTFITNFMQKHKIPQMASLLLAVAFL